MNATSLDTASSGRGDSGGVRRLEPDCSAFECGLSRASEGCLQLGVLGSGSPEKRQIPRQAPGRITRKARAYASEILRLHEAGYTLDAIREALADVGVKVSTSTVWRETTRPTNETSAAPAIGDPRG